MPNSYWLAHEPGLPPSQRVEVSMRVPTKVAASMASAWARPAARLLLLALAGALSLSAQFSSILEGTIADPTGAVIPGVAVDIEDLGTSTVRTVETSSAGRYRAIAMAASTYRVTVTADGFQTYVQERVTLEVAQTTTLNIQLELGQTTETVSVTSEAPLIETGEAKVSGQIEEREVADLPLVGRNFMTLVVLTPGVVGLPSGGGQAYAQATGDIFSAEYGVNLSGNGQRAESNSFNVDGASVNASPRGGVVNHNPNADSVQELRVSVNNFSAEYGRNSSVLVNVVTKSGTNDIHGTVGWYHTNNRLQARNLFQPEVPVFRRNEANWSLGGPIIKNRTFAFGSMDILRSGVGAGYQRNVVSRQFADTVRQRYPDNISSFVMNEFPDNLVPETKVVNATAGGLMGSDCAGSTPIETPIGQLPCNFPVTERGSFAQTLPRDGIQWTMRVDHNFNESKDRIYGSVARTVNQQVLFGNPSVYPAFTQMQEQWTAFANLNWTRIISNNVINELSWAWQHAEGDAPIGRGEIPRINVPGIEGYGQGFSDAVFIQNNQQWRNVTTWNKGSHSFKFGGNFNCDSGCPGAGALFAPVWERPNYGFNNIWDFALDDPFSHNNIGFDPLTGDARGFDFRPRFTNMGLFVNDDWKVRPNLTVSWGLRWEAFFVPTDLDDIFVGAQFRGGSNFTERIADVGIVQGPPLASTDNNNFAPRIGIAWDPTGRGQMSIRAGSGVFYDRPGGQFYRDCCTSLPVFAVANVSKQTVAQPVYGLSQTLESPWNFPRPPELQVGLDERGGLLSGVPSAIQIWEPHLKNQFAVNWFLGIQYALGNDWAVEANYVGSQGSKLYQNYEVNRFSGDLLDGRLDRLNPSFGSITYGQNNGKSYYHGGNVSVKKRFAQGLLFQGAYTFGKAIDTGSSFSGEHIVDLSNMRLNRGRSRFDVRHKYAMSLIYDIPSPIRNGAGRAILGGWQLGTTTILQAGSPFNVNCGLPFQPVFDADGNMTGNTGCDFNADGFNNDYPDAPSFGSSIPTTRQAYLDGVFAASDFPRPQSVRPGTLGRNVYSNPGYANVDLNLLKQMPFPMLGEAGRIDFRAEFFNLFNRVNLGGVNGSIQSGNFGRVTSTFGARNVQFGIKVIF